MRVAVQEKFRPAGGMAGRDVNEMKPMPETFQLQAHRPVGLIVLVSADDENFRPQILNRL